MMFLGLFEDSGNEHECQEEGQNDEWKITSEMIPRPCLSHSCRSLVLGQREGKWCAWEIIWYWSRQTSWCCINRFRVGRNLWNYNLVLYHLVCLADEFQTCREQQLQGALLDVASPFRIWSEDDRDINPTQIQRYIRVSCHPERGSSVIQYKHIDLALPYYIVLMYSTVQGPNASTCSLSKIADNIVFPPSLTSSSLAWCSNFLSTIRV